MQLKRTFVTAAMALLATVASAADSDWNNHDVAEVGVAIVSPGNISDTYNFTLQEPGVLSASAVANNLQATFNITDGVVTLVRLGDDGNTEEPIASFSFNGTSGDTVNSFGEQSLGDYFYRVTGSAAGSVGGVYVLTSQVAAVPEISTFAMLGAGLAALLVVQRRRRGDR